MITDTEILLKLGINPYLLNANQISQIVSVLRKTGKVVSNIISAPIPQALITVQELFEQSESQGKETLDLLLKFNEKNCESENIFSAGNLVSKRDFYLFQEKLFHQFQHIGIRLENDSNEMKEVEKEEKEKEKEGEKMKEKEKESEKEREKEKIERNREREKEKERDREREIEKEGDGEREKTGGRKREKEVEIERDREKVEEIKREIERQMEREREREGERDKTPPNHLFFKKKKKKKQQVQSDELEINEQIVNLLASETGVSPQLAATALRACDQEYARALTYIQTGGF